MNLSYPNLLKEIGFYKIKGRSDSAAFLMWYLEKYFRLDPEIAIDAVCDNSGDKGVDGIYLNEGAGTIDIFQSKIVQSENKSVGDTVLKEFLGTLDQFSSSEKLQNLVDTAGKAEVASLINRLNLISNLDAYKVRGIFVANTELSSDGKSFLSEVDNIEFFGRYILEDQYISDQKEVTTLEEATFDISENETTVYHADTETITYIAPIKASELVELKGINDQSIFDYNVRGALGNTKINKGIVNSIKNSALHKQFPLFHNGITIVAENVERTEDKIIIKKFYVVNGCQSLTSLYRNSQHITDDLRILTKVIKVPINSDLSSKITEYSNSQNGVKPRDFKSYSQIQVRLQNEVTSKFGTDYYYEIKRADNTPSNLEVISNETTGVILMSFDLEEPWNTHRKYRIFEDAHNDLFARPEVTASRVVFLKLLDNISSEKILSLENQLIARYALTRYTLIYIIKNILKKDELGQKLITNPESFVKDSSSRTKLVTALSAIVDEIIIDLDAEINDLDEEFDYKSNLRNESWVKNLSKVISGSYLKQVKRNRSPSFKDEWEELNP